MKRMVFHAPSVVAGGGSAGSSIRPYRMLEAFKEAGYEVIEVTGRSEERRLKALDARRALADGDVEFCYSELSSSPIAMSEPRSAHVDPGVDFDLFAACRRSGVPVGAFYRDIYWRFPGFLTLRQLPYRAMLKLNYVRDLRRLERTVDILFLPSMRMGDYVPIVSPSKFRELPPGAPVERISEGEGVELFYVGSLGAFYDITECLAAVGDAPGCGLTMCVPQDQWSRLRGDYEDLLSDRVAVVHGRGAELDPYFDRATIGVLAMRPIEYRSFAAPVKLFEYIGRGLPILASADTFVGDFVERNGIGWAPRFDRAEIGAVLERLISNPDEVERAASRVREIRGDNTWRARAAQAASALQEAGGKGRTA